MAIEQKYILETFEDIYSGVMEHARQPLTDTITLNKVKRFINNRYQQVSAARKWKWRKETRSLRLYHKLAGLAVLSNGRKTFGCQVDLSEFPDTETYKKRQSVPNFNGWKFYAEGMKEIYTITSLTLQIFQDEEGVTINIEGIIDSPWLGETEEEIAITLFKDTYGLWPDFEEFDDVENRYKRTTIDRVGPAELIYHVNRSPKRFGNPCMITTTGKAIFEGQRMNDFVMGNDFMGIPKGVKAARVYPYLFEQEKQVPIDYIKKIKPLIKTTDKPLMPPEDRICLYFGALADLYGVLKDQTEFENYEAKFAGKVDQMTVDDQEDDDHPQFVPAVDYRSSGRGKELYHNDIYDHDED